MPPSLLKPGPAGRPRGQAQGPRGQDERPGRGRDGALASRASTIEDYANRLFRPWQLGQAREEQRRPPAGRAERAQGPDRGRLRPRRRAHGRSLEGHHHHRRSPRGSRRAISPAASMPASTPCCRHPDGRRGGMAAPRRGALGQIAVDGGIDPVIVFVILVILLPCGLAGACGAARAAAPSSAPARRLDRRPFRRRPGGGWRRRAGGGGRSGGAAASPAAAAPRAAAAHRGAGR